MSIQEPVEILDRVAATVPDAADLPAFSAVLTDACRRWADQIAVTDGDRSISYAELGRRSERIAAAIQQGAPSPTAPVAVFTGITCDLIVALAGVLRSGRPLVVLDYTLPLPRLRTIVTLAGAAEIISDAESCDRAREVAGAEAEVRLLAELEAESSGPLDDQISPDALAAILFTSGSSGQPKGVMWSQRLFAAEALTAGQGIGYRTGERAAMSLPMSFAAGLGMATLGLTWGATLMLKDPRGVDPAEYMEWVRRERITVIHTTPSMLRGLLAGLNPDTQLPDLHLWTAAGEALYDTDILSARRHLPADATFIQWFGSSEGGSLATLRIDGDDPVPGGAIPAGAASPWRTHRIVDADGNDLPAGRAGDLVVSTWVSADGYWADPARTAEKFHRRDDGRIDLRTGDVAMIGENDGLLRLLGRSEAAVKIRGYLVDPSEIEAALLASGRVAESVVIAVQEGTSTRLVAYFVPKRSPGSSSLAALRGWLASQLPIWMVPAHIVALRELPRNDRGKIDRMALPPVPPRRIEPPQGHLELQIAQIWASVLHVDEVGRNEDFIELGGDSLAAETMLAAVEQAVGVRLLTSDLSQATRLLDFVDRLLGSVKPIDEPRWPATEIQLRRGESDRTVFCVAGGGAEALLFVSLMSQLDPSDSVVALVGRGVERRAPAEWSFDGMVRRRIAKVRKHQAGGRYLLLGHSMGAILVLEMARRMAADGDEVVAFLVDPFFGAAAASAQPQQRSWRPHPRVWLGRAKLLLAGLIQPRDERRLGLSFRQAGAVLRRHRPLPFEGKVYAYRTDDNDDPQELWHHLLPNATVRTLATGHISVLQRPFVETIAADVRAEQAG